MAASQVASCPHHSKWKEKPLAGAVLALWGACALSLRTARALRQAQAASTPFHPAACRAASRHSNLRAACAGGKGGWVAGLPACGWDRMLGSPPSRRLSERVTAWEVQLLINSGSQLEAEGKAGICADPCLVQWPGRKHWGHNDPNSLLPCARSWLRLSPRWRWRWRCTGGTPGSCQAWGTLTLTGRRASA